MGTVEVVIKVPKDEYDYIQLYGSIKPFSANFIAKQIANGTVLPEGHGDLVDMNTVTSTYNLQGELTSYDAVVVLEADKEA